MPDKKTSELDPAGPLTGAEIFPLVQAGNTKKETILNLLTAHNALFPKAYKSLTVAISQSGTDDPTLESILEDDINQVIILTRQGVGQYTLDIFDPLFIENKTVVFEQSQVYFLSPFIFTATRNTDNQISIETKLLDGTPSDDMIGLGAFVFEIRIYN